MVSSTVLGISGLGVTWLYNRGGFERKAEQVYAVYLRGDEMRKLLGKEDREGGGRPRPRA